MQFLTISNYFKILRRKLILPFKTARSVLLIILFLSLNVFLWPAALQRAHSLQPHYYNPTQMPPHPGYLFYLLKSMELNSMAEGSSHPLLTQTLLKSIDIRVHPWQKVLNFNEQVSEFWNNIYANQTQILTLTQTRDTLMPKLMSGEVRVGI